MAAKWVYARDCELVESLFGAMVVKMVERRETKLVA